MKNWCKKSISQEVLFFDVKTKNLSGTASLQLIRTDLDEDDEGWDDEDIAEEDDIEFLDEDEIEDLEDFEYEE